MRYELNLASRPFVNTVAPMLVAIVAAIGILIFTLFNVSVLRASLQGGRFSARIENAVERNGRYRERAERVQANLAKIKVAKIRSETEFANGLISDRKRSLSLMFRRLEEVFGNKKVRLIGMITNISRDEVQLRLSVEDRRDSVLQLVDELRDSSHFSEPYIREETVLTDAGGKKWTLELTYHIPTRR